MAVDKLAKFRRDYIKKKTPVDFGKLPASEARAVVPGRGHICVDLDGTLAVYDRWQGPAHIGIPVPKMLARVRRWLARGIEVRIFTARAHPDNPDQDVTIPTIEAWCTRHLGQTLPITCMKGMDTVEFWDDRAVQVRPNTGERADGLLD